MTKFILKLLVSIMVFAGTVWVAGKIMNRDNVNTTRELEQATLPVIRMNVAGNAVNELYGYTSFVNSGLMRNNITPLDENRGVSFRILKYGRKIEDISVQIRTTDGSRLIEIIDVDDYEEDDYAITAGIRLKDLIDEYTEYSMEIHLSLGKQKTAVYYTRVIMASQYCPNEKLAYVLNFHTLSMNPETTGELKEYMESNYLGDNTTLEYVNIHSSMAQLSFGDLTVEEITEPIVQIKELSYETAIFKISYLAKVLEDDIPEKYFIDEYYRIKYTTDVTYLLDFERTMHQIPEIENRETNPDTLYLGISNPNIDISESENGDIFAFVSENKLYYYNVADNKMALLFSFYDDDNFDERTIHNEHGIKILRVDETGNVDFLVYGYMNRGVHEGCVGMTLYSYDGQTNVTDERMFISSEDSPEIFMSEVGDLSYLSKNGYFYFMLDRAIYVVDILNKTTENLVSNLGEDMYRVSKSGSMVVWQTGKDVNACKALQVMNLNTKQIYDITAPPNELIKPLAFMGEDFVYGLAKSEDVLTDSTGRVTFPMYCMKIQNEFSELLMLYEETDLYVTSVETNGNLLTINRVKKKESENLAYEDAAPDYMTSNREQNEQLNYVEVFTDGIYEKVVRIRMHDEAGGKRALLTPREVIYEGSKELIFNRTRSDKHFYYVYYKGKLQNITTKPARAVNLANDNYGTVVNESGCYVWYRANRDLRNQIMDLSLDGDKETENQLSACLRMICDYEGAVQNTAYLLSKGKTTLAALEESLQGNDVLDLTGCSLDSILYYVNRDIPVLALTNTDDTYLIIGFNQLSVVVYNPITGTNKIGRNEAEELFGKSGNRFIAYAPNAQ